MFVHSRFVGVTLAFIIAGCFCVAHANGFARQIERISLDARFRARPPVSAPAAVNIIEITDYDIAQIGVWTWSRAWHAAMVKALSDFGCKAIYFDMLFAEPHDAEGDTLFAHAIKNAGNVYLPMAFTDDSHSTKNALLPIPLFTEHAKAIGSINAYPDEDGVIRRIPVIFPENRDYYQHMALILAADYQDARAIRLDDTVVAFNTTAGTLKIPVNRGNSTLINWYGKWTEGVFRHYRFLDILSAYNAHTEGYAPAIDTSSLRGGIAIIAVTATGLSDIKPVPVAPLYPGAGVFATTVSNFIEGRILWPMPQWASFVIIVVCAFMPLVLPNASPVNRLLFLFAALVVYCVITLALFWQGVVILFVLPVSAMILSYIACLVLDFVKTVKAKNVFYHRSVTDQLTGLYNIGYFKVLLNSEIVSARKALNAADESAYGVVVAMIDIDHFKHFNDTYGHQVGDIVLKEVAGTIKHSVRMTDIVARYGGEEMITMVKGESAKALINVAEKIRQNVANSVSTQYRVTVSVGVAILMSHDTVDTVIKRADQALYQAKNAGRNRAYGPDGPLAT